MNVCEKGKACILFFFPYTDDLKFIFLFMLIGCHPWLCGNDGSTLRAKVPEPSQAPSYKKGTMGS